MAEEPASILTPTQRKYLKNGPEESPDASERAMRSRIRERVRQAFRDFSILFEYWPEEEREKVFFNLRNEGLDEPIVDTIALLYGETKLGGRFKNRLWRGVQKAERRAAGSDELDVRTNFEVETIDTVNLEKAVEKYRREKYDEMTDGEMRSVFKTLRRTGAVTPESLNESLQERQEEIRRRVSNLKRNRAEHWREKQGRARDSNGE
jgi:hypothetical protein